MRRKTENIVAVIPVRGRLPLLAKTLARFSRQTLRPVGIVCIGETPEEKETVENSGGIFVSHPNSPLGEKWHFGVMEAKRLFGPKIDALLITGSSDWFTDNWCSVCAGEMDRDGAWMAGKTEIRFYDIAVDGSARMLYVPRYEKPNRVNEPFGAGKLVAREALDAFGWNIYARERERGLDRRSYSLVVNAKQKICLIRSEGVYVMDIGFSGWGHKHSIESMMKHNGLAKIVEDPDGFLSKWFPDALALKEEAREWARALPETPSPKNSQV